MASLNPRPDDSLAYPGEAGIETLASPPFVAEDESTRWLFALNRMGIRPGLGRIRGLLADLDHPERSLRTLVVAGTNGKGTATRVLASLLEAAGYRTACFTSPHLLRVYERLTLDGRPVDPGVFAAAVERVRPLTERHEASWFETLTAVALTICRDAGIEALCCETGLGGRLDASNALPAEAVLLTGVALDHQHILGGTLQEIAAEKLGLLKQGVPLFASLPAELREQAFAAAVAAGSPCHFFEELARVETRDGRWDLMTRHAAITGLPPLPSPPLRRSAALALLALSELDRAGGLRLPADPAAALAGLFLPGRFQTVLTAPDWIFDTAHNSQALAASLEHFLSRPCAGRRVVLFGSMQDKELEPAVGEALGRADLVLGVPVALPRARNSAELGELTKAWGLGEDSVRLVGDSEEALAVLRDRLSPDDAVLVTGSCFLVGEVLHRLGFRDLEQTRTPTPAAAKGFGRAATSDPTREDGR